VKEIRRLAEAGWEDVTLAAYWDRLDGPDWIFEGSLPISQLDSVSQIESIMHRATSCVIHDDVLKIEAAPCEIDNLVEAMVKFAAGTG